MILNIPKKEPFLFHWWTCYPVFYSKFYAWWEQLIVDMFQWDKVKEWYSIDIDYLHILETFKLTVPVEFHESFTSITGTCDKIGQVYYRYSSGKCTVEPIWDAVYLDYPEEKTWFWFIK